MHSRITVVSLFVSFFILGCSIFYPQLQRQSWSSIEVDYCVGEGERVQMKTWSTNDPIILKQLKKSYHATSISLAWTAGYMNSNEIRLTLANGKVWNIYIYSPTTYKLIDPTDKDSFHLDLKLAFFETLKAMIEKHEARSIHFYYFKRVTIVKE